MTRAPRTLFEKLWASHVVAGLDEDRALLHVDRHMLHDLTSPQAFDGLRRAGRSVRNPELTYAVQDHLVATDPGRTDDTVPGGRELIRALRANARAAGIELFDLDDPRQGIVHVVAPELGIALPGMTFVCGDSHTCTVGALGAYAWGIGTSDVEHVLATQTLAQRKPRTLRVSFEGVLAPAVTAKDMALYLIGRIGMGGATGHALEYAGAAVRGLGMEGRMTLCNMAIECGARAALVAPDDTTYEYLRGRPYAPAGPRWDEAVAQWRALPSEDGAQYDRDFTLDARAIAPQVTWGTRPQDVAPIDGRVPDPGAAADVGSRGAVERALDYMGLAPGAALEGLPIDRVFIGSCTNSRLTDLRDAARVVRGRRVAAGVRAIVVPGSMAVKRAAEAEGLDRVFVAAGFEWREPGCSMCAGLNPDKVGPRERCIATSNRNFEGRQGPLARTHLASPAMAAAAAVTGRITDVRKLGT
jgi:3-isopropylmalate/(R)-2-methylmalate dehydratase large subunit